jgi:hypothetical protein
MLSSVERHQTPTAGSRRGRDAVGRCCSLSASQSSRSSPPRDRRSAQECCPTPPQAPEQRTATALIASLQSRRGGPVPTRGRSPSGNAIMADAVTGLIKRWRNTGTPSRQGCCRSPHHGRDARCGRHCRTARAKGEQLLRKACLIFHGVCGCKTRKRLSRDAIGSCKSIPEPRTRQNGARTC